VWRPEVSTFSGTRVEKFPSPEGLGNFRRKFPEKVEIFGKFWKYLGKSGNF
jgi:hypothetical protein